MIDSMPKFIQGVFTFTGAGYDSPVPIAAEYTVPGAKRAQLIYFRAGNSAPAMVSLILLRDGTPMRYFPIAAHGATHVPLAVVEDLEPDQKLTLTVAAPAGEAGTLVLDIGLIEI
jgi:hypothetical protein